MRYIPALSMFVVALAIAGCSSEPVPVIDTTPKTVFIPERLNQEFEVTWGFSGRGGAALRKPTYQHVLGTEDVVETRQGPLKDWNKLNGATGVPDGVVVYALNNGYSAAVGRALKSAPDYRDPSASLRDQRLASLKPTTAEYTAAYRKFCAGATTTMTEREWEIVALGGPKGVPAGLRGSCAVNK